MMYDVQNDVELFMDAMGQHIRSWPQTIPEPERRLRLDLIEEEYDEVIEAMVNLRDVDVEGIPLKCKVKKLAALADGVADLVYVLLGTASSYGIDMQDVWNEVQATNMHKTSGPVANNGKRLKPEGWAPPNIEGIIREQMAEHYFADESITGTDLG